MIAPRIRTVLAGLLASAAFASLAMRAPDAAARSAVDRTDAGRPTVSQRRAPDPLRNEMLALVNRSRRLHGLPTFRLDRRVSREALGHSRTMAAARAISHTPDLASIISRAGGTVFGEDVGKGRSLRGIRDAWIRHLDTRRILLDGRFHRAGLGVLHVNGFFWITLQVFD